MNHETFLYASDLPQNPVLFVILCIPETCECLNSLQDTGMGGGEKQQ